jgi:hypothetical protein
VRFSSLFSRSHLDADQLMARCVAADRVAARCVAALARASDRHLAKPDDGAALAQHEAAEELLFIAEFEQRQARAALERARRRRRFARHAGDPAGTTEPSP